LDKYRYWTVEAIKKDLDRNRVPLEVAIENFQHDMNIGTIVRTANAFIVSAVHIIGKRHWNRRGAMVTDVYMHIHYYSSAEDFSMAMKEGGKTIVAVDIVEGAKPISKVKLPKNAVLVFGGEGPGLSKGLLKAADLTVKVEQTGSTRSVNVGVAAGISMYMWLLQHSLTR
jgi:tRNA G18 (ribose-2'-O)-methylase SpoU